MIDSIVPYAAGFFDGEGSIDIRYCRTTAKSGKSYERFYLRVQIIQMDTRPLEVIQARWGGSITKRSKSACKTLVWSTSAACKFLRDIRPFLIVKAAEADIAIEFQETMRAALVNTAGSKGVDRLSDSVRQKRYDLMIAMRDARAAKGLFARPRANVPVSRSPLN